MTSDQFNEVVKERIEKCLSVICKKAKEYANDTDRLRAFKAAAAIEKTSPYEALGGMLAKHIVSIYDMLGDAERYSKDKWDEKIGDTINYLLLLDALLNEYYEEDLKNAEN